MIFCGMQSRFIRNTDHNDVGRAFDGERIAELLCGVVRLDDNLFWWKVLTDKDKEVVGLAGPG
jgi:hypothetical protein